MPFLLLLLVVLGALFFLRNPSNVKNESSLPQVNSRTQLGASAQVDEVRPRAFSESATVPSPKKLEEARRLFNAKVLTGLKEIAVSKRKTDMKLTVQTKAEPQWCRTGDFDLFKSLVDDANKPIFLLSIEPLNRENKAIVQSQSLSLLDILKGKPAEFVMPILTKAKDYGLYICLDSAKSKECGSKRSMSGNQWDAAVAKGGSLDRVLYYQSFTTLSDKAFLIPSSDWSEATIAQLKTDLKITMEDSSNSLNQLSAQMKRLGSLPAVPENRYLALPLPYRDPRCGEKN